MINESNLAITAPVIRKRRTGARLRLRLEGRGRVGLLDAERAVEQVGEHRGRGAGRKDDRPNENRMAALGDQLQHQRGRHRGGEDQRADDVADTQGDREDIADRLAQDNGADFHDPKGESDLGDLGRGGGCPEEVHRKGRNPPTLNPDCGKKCRAHEKSERMPPQMPLKAPICRMRGRPQSAGTEGRAR